MNFDHYAARAVALANGDASTPEGLRALAGPSRAGAVTDGDLPVATRAGAELRRVFEAGAAGDEEGAVALINDLLPRYPLSPRVSGHGGTPWHLHVGDGSSVGSALAAEALFGLVMVVTTLGPGRLGVCGAPDCDDAFVDLSPNRSRRFCGDRCATRTNVAAFRRRRAARAGA